MWLILGSFNLDMDKYLEKRGSIKEKVSSSSNYDKKNKKEKKKKKLMLSKLKDAVNALIDVDEVINLDDENDSSVKVFRKRTFTDKMVDFLKHTDSVELKIPSQDITTKQKNENQSKTKLNLNNKKSNSDSSKFHSAFSILSPEKTDEKDIPKEEVQRVIKESSNISADASTCNEFRDDLRDIILITYKIIRKVPPEALREFRESQDYKRYVSILDKYNLVRKNEK